MRTPYRSLSATITLILPIFCQLSNALLENGFNITNPSWFFDGVLSPATAEELPAACVAAYTKPINCNITVLMSPNVDTKNETLEDFCNPECATSLQSFQENVRQACEGANLRASGLDTSWLDAVISGEASILLYWKQCLRNLDTNELCEISKRDYGITWDPASVESTTGEAIKKFCTDNCLTQSVVLNVPTEKDLGDLRAMCSYLKIEDFPFINAMVFADLVDDSNGTVIAVGTNTTESQVGVTSGSGRNFFVGLELVATVSLLYVFVLC